MVMLDAHGCLLAGRGEGRINLVARLVRPVVVFDVLGVDEDVLLAEPAYIHCDVFTLGLFLLVHPIEASADIRVVQVQVLLDRPQNACKSVPIKREKLCLE